MPGLLRTSHSRTCHLCTPIKSLHAFQSIVCACAERMEGPRRVDCIRPGLGSLRRADSGPSGVARESGNPARSGSSTRPPIDCSRARPTRWRSRSICFLVPLGHACHAHALVHALVLSEIDGIVAEGQGSKPRNGEARIELETGARSVARFVWSAEVRQCGSDARR